MSMIRRSFQVSYELQVQFTQNVFEPTNSVLKTVLDHSKNGPHKTIIVLDEALAQTQPDLSRRIEAYFETHSDQLQLLASLSPRDKRAGYIEAVKVALIRDQEFFANIERDAARLSEFEPAAMQQLIYRCAELHVNHIATAGDPFEFGSARPLDFGHWAAHKLEQLSEFKIRHGEAVAIGIALDVIYSRRLGFVDAGSTERILQLIEVLGFDL